MGQIKITLSIEHIERYSEKFQFLTKGGMLDAGHTQRGTGEVLEAARESAYLCPVILSFNRFGTVGI